MKWRERAKDEDNRTEQRGEKLKQSVSELVRFCIIGLFVRYFVYFVIHYVVMWLFCEGFGLGLFFFFTAR